MDLAGGLVASPQPALSHWQGGFCASLFSTIFCFSSSSLSLKFSVELCVSVVKIRDRWWEEHVLTIDGQCLEVTRPDFLSLMVK